MALPRRRIVAAEQQEKSRLANQPVTKSEDQPRGKTGVME
jgi:hypothetical protein